MIKLARFLKPFTFGLVLAIVFLFIQAFCDLSLPNYMSKIVNVGIQQSGIDKACPEALSPEAMALMRALMPEGDKDLIERSYSLSNTGTQKVSSDGRQTVRGRGEIALEQAYPDAGDEIFLLEDISEDERNALDAAFGNATWTLIYIMREVSGGSAAVAEEEAIDYAAFEMPVLYEMLPMLETVPEEILNGARAKALENGAEINSQSGIILTGAFYRELGVDMAEVQKGYIIYMGAMMLIIALVSGLATIIVSFFSSRISAGVARDLRGELFERIESFGNAEFEKFAAASLITRSTNDITQIQQFILMGIRMVCFSPIMGVGGIIMALRSSISMGWIIALACVILFGLIITVTVVAIPKFKLVQKLMDRLNLVARESLTGLMVIRAFGNESYEEERFKAANADLTKINLFVVRVMVTMMPLMMLIMNGVTLLIVWVGAHQIAESSMQVGDMLAFMQYAMQIIMSFLMISMVFILAPRAAVSAERIAQVLETQPEIKEPENPESMDESKLGYVEFRGVGFRYNDAQDYALEDVSFTAMPGKTTAFIGSTGSGKSTAANLLLRFYDVTQGQILVGGVDIRKLRLKDLRGCIGYVPQRSMLLRGTIASNLSYGKRDSSMEELKGAAEIAQAMEFINEREEGFQSGVSQSGGNLSGGQKQRLSIARALAKKPDILLFDDSFSALDFKTDAALRRKLRENTSESAVIIVAQRVSTIMNADQIIVFEKGRIAGCGTHKELLDNCREYREIVSSQLGKEEMA